MSDAISISDLLRKIDAGEELLLLDVRNAEEFARWRVEGRRPFDTMHRPYFDFIEDESLLDTVARAAAVAPPSAAPPIPAARADEIAGSTLGTPGPTRGTPGPTLDPAGPRRQILAICAKGDSSELIADMLRQLGVAARNVIGGMVAYGEYLQPVKVPLDRAEARRFEIWQMNRRGKGCLSYVVRSGSEAVVIDPSRAIAGYETFVDSHGASIVAVFDTHVHADHISGGPKLAPRHGAPYFVAAGPGVELRHPIRALEDGEEIRLGGETGVTLTVRILSTPGHTPGSTSFLVGNHHLLTGDTIFVESVGRPDLGGQVVEWGKMLFRTLNERISALPDDVVILPAHYASTTEIGPGGVVAGRLGHLRRTVPELQIRSESEFIEAMKRALKSHPEVYDEIIRVNLGLQSLDEETATEWELGKNECAASVRRRTEVTA